MFTPLFVAMILGIAFLKIGGFSYEDYKSGGDIIKFFLEPATIAFAIPLYKQVESLKKYWLQILGAIIAGSVCSVAVVYLIANALHLDGAVMKACCLRPPRPRLRFLYQKESAAFKISRPSRHL